MFECSSHPHPYSKQGKLNYIRSRNTKSQAATSTNNKLTFIDEDENSIIDDKVNTRRKHVPPVCHKVAVTNTDRSSKWSKFLGDDARSDGTEISSHTVSDHADDDSFPVTGGYSAASLQPFVVSMLFFPYYIITVYVQKNILHIGGGRSFKVGGQECGSGAHTPSGIQRQSPWWRVWGRAH